MAGRSAFALLALVVSNGCGGEDCCTIDAALSMDAPVIVDGPPASSNSGFMPPQELIAAWSRSGDTYEPAVLDLSCVGIPRDDSPTAITVSLTATVRDFQSTNLVPGAMVKAFEGVDLMTPLSSDTADANGTATLSIPAGTQRIGFSIEATSSMRTITLDRLLAPATANQTIELPSFSDSTASTLPALVGQTRTPGTALVVGEAHDCRGHLLSGLIATVSSVAGMPVHAPGATTYYFSDMVGLPVTHSQAGATTRDGHFMVIELQPATRGYVQLWGFRDESMQTAGALVLVAELAIPLPGDTVVVTEDEPHTLQ